MRIRDWSSDVCSSDLLFRPGDLAVVVAVDQEPQRQPRQRGEGQHDAEFLLSLLAAFGAPWQQVDPGHQSKLLRASPQAISSAGASWASACACTRGPSVMCARGLAATVCTPGCASTISDRSEGRRGGKEWFHTCRSLWMPYQLKQKNV